MKNIFSFCLSILSFGAIAQVTATKKITIDLKGAPNGKYVQLAHYYGNNQYIKVDSSLVQENRIVFSSPEPFKGGVYLLVLSPNQYYDFVISGDEQDFSFTADTTDFVQSVKFTNSKENEVLFSYRKYIVSKSNEARSLSEQIARESDASKKKALQQTLSTLQKNATEELNKITQTNPMLFSSKVIKANTDPKTPDKLPTLPNGRPDSTYLFNYYKNHFFDHIDFSDERFLRTPVLQSRIERYFKDLVYQVSDSIIIDSDRVLALAQKNQDIYRFVLWQLANKYENTEIVGLDGVFVHLAENHYLKKATWLDEKQRTSFTERVKVLKPLVTGKVFPSLVLQNSQGNNVDIAQAKATYKIILFYSPDCGHCKEAAPKLMQFYNSYGKANNVLIYNISIDYEADTWSKFISEYKTEPLINLWDAKKSYIFRDRFDVYATPTSYILDNQNRIIAKRIPVEELERFLQFYERKNKQ
ncbi:MAG: thioredoxin-like domain-containing protein [Spirosomataceae bacterium]